MYVCNYKQELRDLLFKFDAERHIFHNLFSCQFYLLLYDKMMMMMKIIMIIQTFNQDYDVPFILCVVIINISRRSLVGSVLSLLILFTFRVFCQKSLSFLLEMYDLGLTIIIIIIMVITIMIIARIIIFLIIEYYFVPLYRHPWSEVLK